MQAVVTGSCVSQQSARNVVQTEHVILFPEQQQPAVRNDLRTMKFQPYPRVKTKPNITRFACTLRVAYRLQIS
jgi:hypothetical protein